MIESQHGGVLGTSELKRVIEQYQLIDPIPEKIDEVSIDLHLGNRFIRIKSGRVIIGQPLRPEQLEEFEISDGGSVLLEPGERLLGVTREIVQMPKEYFGVIQTKGGPSRAGLRIQDDFQIGPGFRGPITLQLKNMHDPYYGVDLEIPIGQAIGSLFLFTVVGEATPYTGKFQDATGPTIDKT